MQHEIDCNGQLDMAARALELAAENLAHVWDEGRLRLKPDDIKRIARYLSRVRVSTSRVRDALKLFEAIALHENGPRLLETLAQPVEARTITVPPEFFAELDVSRHEK